MCCRGAPHPHHASSPGGLALACFSPLRYLPWSLKHVFLPSLSTLLSSLLTSPSCQSIHSRKPEMSAGSHEALPLLPFETLRIQLRSTSGFDLQHFVGPTVSPRREKDQTIHSLLFNPNLWEFQATHRLAGMPRKVLLQ